MGLLTGKSQEQLHREMGLPSFRVVVHNGYHEMKGPHGTWNDIMLAIADLKKTGKVVTHAFDPE